MTTKPRDPPSCTVIVATLALEERADLVARALDSIRPGNQCRIEILVVVNGNRFSESLVGLLQGRGDVQVCKIGTPSLAAAILEGRKRVSTEYFAFLDDDDEYLPGAVDQRVDLMERDAGLAVVAANGIRKIGTEEEPVMGVLSNVRSDPLMALFDENWLASCGGLFRTSEIPVRTFEDVAKYLEWTWIAYVIASEGKKIDVLDEPTYRIHDTQGSESKSQGYHNSQLSTYDRMLAIASRADVKQKIWLRRTSALHAMADRALDSGRVIDAWRHHLRSLFSSGGLRYLLYTRRLIVPLFVGSGNRLG